MKGKNESLDAEKILDILENDGELLKKVSRELLLKRQRIVINFPGWLAKKLRKESERSGLSMNEIVRIAVEDYLSK